MYYFHNFWNTNIICIVVFEIQSQISVFREMHWWVSLNKWNLNQGGKERVCRFAVAVEANMFFPFYERDSFPQSVFIVPGTPYQKYLLTQKVYLYWEKNSRDIWLQTCRQGLSRRPPQRWPPQLATARLGKVLSRSKFYFNISDIFLKEWTKKKTVQKYVIEFYKLFYKP